MNKRLVLLGIMLILSLGTFEALLLTGPTWSPSSPFTNDTLNCSWSASGDTTLQNISILRNGILFNSTFENASEQGLSTNRTIPPDNTSKNQVWTCQITLFNGTSSTSTAVNVTVLNTPPTTEIPPAGVFNDTNEDIGFLVQILEDTTMNIDVNATDGDNDTLTYLGANDFCTLTSSSAGTYTCSPTQNNIVNNSPTTVDITFTVTDGQNPSGRTVTFNVTPVNDPPNASLSNQNTPVNQSLNYTFTAADEEPNYPLNFSLIAPSEISDKLSIARLNVNGTSVSIYYDGSTPDFNDVGVHNITVNITDAANLSGLHNYTFNISAVGRNPYFVNTTPQGPYNISQGEFTQINITANDEDLNTTITFSDDTTRFEISTVIGNTNLSDAFGQINFTPSNGDVGVYSVIITITDTETLENTTTLEFNVTNVNDPPVVNEISTSSNNTQGNTNASNLSAYENALFVYDVNATDLDIIHGDTLNYTDNTSLFDIGLLTGKISFIPNNSQVSVDPYHVNITVTDASGLQDSRTVVITILNNTPPFFNATLPQLNCTTDALCSLDVSSLTDDPDAGDNVSSYNMTVVSGNLSSFNYSTTSGLISFIPAKTEVANYTVNITIFDNFGASNSSLMNISINNTPVAPNLTQFDISSETIVETHVFNYELRATDQDFLVSAISESVSFTTNLTVNYTITPLTPSGTTARATLQINPLVGDAGNYTIYINATDIFGLVSQENITFEIFETVPPPNITQITPWGNGSNFSIQTTFANTTDAQFADETADVNFSENTTVTFATIVNDTRPLTYNWTLNGTAVSTSQNYTREFNFTSGGRYLVSLNVSNDRLESAYFTWDLDVTDFNRPPELQNNLPDQTVNGTLQISDYFILGNSQNRFFDPDDDIDNSGSLNGNETNTLSFSTSSSCSVASFAITSSTLTITGSSVGSCVVIFNATDTGGVSIGSNNVTINITDVTEGSQQTVTITSSGGGGGSSTTSTFIPFAQEKKKPEAFHLIAPKLVTIYANDSIAIPITINNTWNTAIKFLQLSAETNVSDVETSFDADFFEEIPHNESREVILTVSNYRLGENYEILVRGNTSDPEYEDEALILLNSIEQSSEGSEVQVKVTFANDLLNQHPECQELNEVLAEAKQKLQNNNIDEAGRLVDSVISGCKYLVSTEQRFEERPSKLSPIIKIDDISMRLIMWSVLAFVLILSIALLIYYHYTHNPEDDI